MRDFSLWPLQATLLQSSYKALSHRRRLQQALAAVCHWKDTNLTQGVHPVRSNLASNFSARTSSRNSSAWHVCWMPIAKSCQLSSFFSRQIRACAPLKPELSQQPMGNDMERQRRKRLAKRRAIFSLYQQVGSYEKLMFSRDTIVLSFLPAIVLVFKIPQTSKGNASENV